MEQLLNLVWLVAVLGLGVAIVGNLHTPATKALRWLTVIVVFACVALLLFPVISASDDLHATFDLSDDAAWRHDKRGAGAVALFLMLLPLCVIALSVAPDRFYSVIEDPGCARSGHLHATAGRAPPFAV